MSVSLSYSKEVRFLRHEDETYMLRPYRRELYEVSYAAYKQTATGFAKVCCFDCKSDDYPEEVLDALLSRVDLLEDFGDGTDYSRWKEAERAWDNEEGKRV